jgi:1,2-beta-oligoglucan phosphorylase
MEPKNLLPHRGQSRLTSPAGLSVEMNANGSLRRMDHGDIILNLLLGNEMEGGPTNLFLRRLGDMPETTPLLGPNSPSCYTSEGQTFTAAGKWGDLSYTVRLVLANSLSAWFWHVELENNSLEPITCDLIYTQDLALANYGAVQLNEYYVSQYLDHTPLIHQQHGVTVASRQNQSMGGRCPWTVIGSLGRGVSYATDALQFHGLATRAGGKPIGLAAGLPGKRHQHEHSMVCIQDEPFTLASGVVGKRGFFGLFQNDKPTATSSKDLVFIEQVMSLPEAVAVVRPSQWSQPCPSVSLFTHAPFLESLDLNDHEVSQYFGDARRHEEREAGQLLSFFAGASSHVVLRAKECQVLRPHGHLLRSGGSLTADESALTSTAWMGGVFHSMVTQGHVSINRFLSTCHTYLGLFRSHGQRVFVEIEGRWHLLGLPSAFEMSLSSCRWLYRHAGGVIEVTASAPDDRYELYLSISVIKGAAARFLISHHIAINGDDGNRSTPLRWKYDERGVFVQAVADSDVGRRFPDGGFRIISKNGVEIEKIGGDELLFTDGVSRSQPFLCVLSAPSKAMSLTIRGDLIPSVAHHPPHFWRNFDAGLQLTAPRTSPLAASAGRVAEIFPWFIQNALVHYLSPRGLEQYSGGGWGTRDVCQGPLELLLALGRFDAMRDLLLRVFRQQNADGDWPQWFMFFDRERGIRPGDSHGDIVYWPVLALAQYLAATGDAGVLEEVLPYFHPAGEAAAEKVTLYQHVERAIELIQKRVIPGTNLAAYGHGDWNDSLQPVEPEMREKLCSSWTVTLNYQTFITLAGALRSLGNEQRAAELEAQAAMILMQFQETLIVDDITTGLAYFREEGVTDLLVHPQDQTTGLSYSVLPMVHAIINGMFTPAQAEFHLDLIRKYLLGPDGVHLFDRPMTYQGGPQKYFQRAESASFFGREIGIMYTHAHLRYAEALARFGDAEAFFKALCQANPIAIRELVPTATLRQANCYYSSSDPAFHDRYEASADYGKVARGEVALEGGWRVYSSGAGISVRLIFQCFLGIRLERFFLVIDPVIPVALDGMRVQLEIAGRLVEIIYHFGGRDCGPVAIHLNTSKLRFRREANPYRLGAARIAMADFATCLSGQGDVLEIFIG